MHKVLKAIVRYQIINKMLNEVISQQETNIKIDAQCNQNAIGVRKY